MGSELEASQSNCSKICHQKRFCWVADKNQLILSFLNGWALHVSERRIAGAPRRHAEGGELSTALVGMAAASSSMLLACFSAYWPDAERC